ncbi:DEAD/DEAH box helicase family protein [Corynebacterium auriscanis]|uniref:DEAD/DEAH box helicase family protein n=1 Tax=Corynebacterium auriscanis TaxID=99807 RepID=UPI003CFB8F4D
MTHTIPPSNFGFVGRVWPALLNDCVQAERNALNNPVVTCFYARRVLERLVKHIWEFRALGSVVDGSTFGRLKDNRFTAVATTAQLAKMHYIRLRGNDAVHDGARPVTPQTAQKVVAQLFDILAWATARHSANPSAQPHAPFNPQALEATQASAQLNQAQVKKLAADLEAKDAELDKTALLLSEAEQARLTQAEQHAEERALFAQRSAKAEEQRAATEAELAAAREQLTRLRAERDAEIERLRSELRDELAAKAGTGAAPTLAPTISESETRRDLIDPMLAAAGFYIDKNVTVEHPVHGMPVSAESPLGNGYVDYVLWDDDGLPLAVVEAKRSGASLTDGAVQARLYADCLETKHGRRPIIFCTNGHLIEMTDDRANLPGSGRGYPTRPVEGYPTAQQLRRMINRRNTRSALSTALIDPQIAGRDYQQQMIRRVTESFEDDYKRRALLVMATGTGKTRVAVATAKLLRESNWVGNVLFLADRTALVDQAHDNFVDLYPESAPVNVLRKPDGVGGVYISTYQTMMGLINDDGNTPAQFRPFDFDLIIIDEAHRSIYRRFKRILDYFDAYVLGLTATPKAEVHRNTYQLFDIDDKDPTGSYTLEQAIEDKYLVPPQILAQDSLFLRSGMRYDDLNPEEQQTWDAAEWGTDEDGNPLDPPDGVTAAEINSRLYNRDTIRKVLKTLFDEGLKLEGGDRLGKTIIFARTQQHAALIKQELDTTFPKAAGERASVITHSTRYASTELKRFKNPASSLDIAISVDMLDTGVDVPEVLNLVFFKPVYSSTKFWQMMGRGTRLRPHLFGNLLHKDKFRVFDFCGNVQFFMDHQPEDTGLTRQISLSEKLFLSRATLISLLGRSDENTLPQFQNELATYLHEKVQSISLGNIHVHPRDRPFLEHFRRRASWDNLTEENVEELGEHIAHLPMKTPEEKESAKRFDLLILQLQLSLLVENGSWSKNRQKVEYIAEELMGVSDELPFVAAVRPTLEALISSDWWDGVTITELESVRRELRSLVEYIPRHKRQVVILDVEDEFGDIAEVDIPLENAAVDVNLNRVENELRSALQQHRDSLAMQKLRSARPLTPSDVRELERMVADIGLKGIAEVRKNLGGDTIPAFIRRLVGLDESAMKAEFAELLEGSTLTSHQIGFIRYVVKVLVTNGGLTMQEAASESFYPYGRAADLFRGNQTVIVNLMNKLERINSTANVS